jgi:hypothetical protein
LLTPLSGQIVERGFVVMAAQGDAHHGPQGFTGAQVKVEAELAEGIALFGWEHEAHVAHSWGLLLLHRRLLMLV